ncbi:MAG: hypothetical protein EBZ93_13680 [Actinobacteria bacterium]|nr:hypothetical protein [Actinomycetota bacterium]
MSTSSVQSGRHVGTVTEMVSPCNAPTKPSGAMSDTISWALNCVPNRAPTRFARTSMTTGLGRCSVRASTAPSCTTRSGHVSRSSSMKRDTEASMPYGSIPRSKRAEASLRKPLR